MSKSEYEIYKVVQRKPERIILIRHGESEGNVNHKIYSTTPDNKINLTDLGKEQARVAGENIKKLVGDESCFFYLSPFQRTRQTFEQISKAWVRYI
jgi:broad specificity phosphatase PhoE